MVNGEEKLADARREMVRSQLRARGIVNEQLLAAFQSTPRDRFVPADKVPQAYGDHPVPIGYGQTISQPLVVAMMIQELAPKRSHRILDVGAGSGYQTAILAALVKHVYAVERIAELSERAVAVMASINVSNVTLQTCDGSMGWPEEAPFDGVICGAGAPEVPVGWIDQLVDGGRIVMPIGATDDQSLVVVEKQGRRTTRREVCKVRFVKLIGQESWPA